MKYIFLMLCFVFAFQCNAQLPSGYSVVKNITDSMQLVQFKGKVGLFSPIYNELMLMPEYDSIGKANFPGEGLILIYKKGKAGIADIISGSVYTLPVYEEIHQGGILHPTLALVKRKNKYGLIEVISGYEVVHPQIR
jgi:hypothetical protein